MGPSSVAAVKIGGVNMQFDMPFLYGMVNGDLITWVRDDATGRWRKVSVDTDFIGAMVYTKRRSPADALDTRPDDITLSYKFREGSREERESMENAGRHMNIAYVYDPSVTLRAGSGDVGFRFRLDAKQHIGRDLQVTYQLFNKVNRPQTIAFRLTVWTVYYSGRDGEEVRNVDEKIRLESKEGECSRSG